MKKIVFLFILVLFVIPGCGNTSDVGVHLTNSQRYTNAELKDAVEALMSLRRWDVKKVIYGGKK